MIRIHKPKTAPAVLRREGKEATAALRAAYDDDPDAYARGERSFDDFDRVIYAAESVKQALRAAQHDKCAFCESQLTHVSYGDVEHLRPKAGFRQQEGDPLGRPGYYWLAYAWTNLFLSCQICNQRFKRNLFPLADPDHRARCHRHRVGREQPLLIDPGAEEPADFLMFDDEYAKASDGSLKGATTIEVLGLNREELATRRRTRLAALRLLLDARRQLLSRRRDLTANATELRNLRNINAYLQEQRQDRAEYAAMMRAAIAKALART